MRHVPHAIPTSRRPRVSSCCVIPCLLVALYADPIAVLAQQQVGPGNMPETYRNETPPVLVDVGITDRTGKQVPLGLRFRDSTGREISLQDIVRADCPTILTLNYYRCPMLCTLTLNGLVDAMDELGWSAGREFDVITVSIDPGEGPDIAALKKKGYIDIYGRDSAAEGWYFLTGEEDQIASLADAVGFGFRFDAPSGEFAHSSSIIFLAPDGTISAYMNDVVFDPEDVQVALTAAAGGEIGPPMNSFLLFTCFQYDPISGSHTVSVMKLMRFAGILACLGVGIGITMMSRQDHTGGGQGALAGRVSA